MVKQIILIFFLGLSSFLFGFEQSVLDTDHEQIVSLSGTWAASSDSVNAVEYYQLWKSNKETYTWKKYFVPGDVNSVFPVPWAKDFKVFVKKEIVINGNVTDLSMRLGAISDRDRTYFNGKLIGSTGTFDSDYPQAYDKVRIYQIPESLININGKNLVMVEVQSYYDSYMGLHQDAQEIGPSQLIAKKMQAQQFLKIFMIAVFYAIAMVFLFIGLNSIKNLEYIYFSLFLLTFATFHLLGTDFLHNQLPYYINKQISFSIVSLLFPLMLLFIQSYFHKKLGKFQTGLNAIMITVSVLFLFTFDFRLKDNIIGKILVYVYGVYMVAILATVIREALKRNKDALLMITGMVLIVVSAVADILSSYSLIVFPKASPYAMPIFIIGLAGILGNNIVRMRETLNELNHTLEKKVLERTRLLEQTTAEIAQKNIETKELVHILCHDLINPIHSAKGFLEISDTYEEFDKYKPKMELCLRNGLNIIDLVRKMRALEENKTSLELSLLSFDAMLYESLQILREILDKKQIIFSNKVLPGLSVLVERSSFINSVLNNLITNAVKFSNPGSQVSLTSKISGSDRVEISLQDQGIGMPRWTLENLFDMSKPTSRKGTGGEKGTGFGMPLVKKFVEAYGGTIKVTSRDIKESPENHGSTVTLTLRM